MGDIYTNISEETLRGAAGRALDALHAMTNGEADKAIEIAKEYIELESILDDLEERKSI